ncbi:hypothetical protein [Alcanivorax jadensis]|uniref:Bbp19 family protein n=1 Tax=Alcanivorax jadensis TaxID=64988 RepID=UPI0023569035|nr:hypothetical protein [Alcanivorax jadensis]|tara:strand:- start:1783 stop:2124 length:342 start_codon:yes stop_codon:yes gene_type:complete
MSEYSESGVDRQNELAERRMRQREQDFRAVLGTAEGRRVMWALIGDCDCFSPIAATNASVYLLQGRKNVGLQLMNEIESVDPEAFMSMLIEGRQQQIDDRKYLMEMSSQDGDS